MWAPEIQPRSRASHSKPFTHRAILWETNFYFLFHSSLVSIPLPLESEILSESTWLLSTAGLLSSCHKSCCLLDTSSWISYRHLTLNTYKTQLLNSFLKLQISPSSVDAVSTLPSVQVRYSLLPLSFLQIPNMTQSHSLRLPNRVQSCLFLPTPMSPC